MGVARHPASGREALLRAKVTERSALVEVIASTQQLTSHAGLVLVRELAGRLGVGELHDRVAVKKRSRGYSPSQVILGLCETLIAGGECLDDISLLRSDSAQQLLRGHGLPEATTLGRFLRRFSLGHIGQLNRALEELFGRVYPLLGRGTVTLDLDATYIEHHDPVGSRQGTCGIYKDGVCWHPSLCFAGETGAWLHAKLRNPPEPPPRPVTPKRPPASGRSHPQQPRTLRARSQSAAAASCSISVAARTRPGAACKRRPIAAVRSRTAVSASTPSIAPSS